MKDLGTALVSGLVGALIAAFLSYIVRLRAKKREDQDERKRLAHVNFLLLTDTVASDLLLTHMVENILKALEVNEDERFGHSHAAASAFAAKIAEVQSDDLVQVHVLVKPFIAAWMSSIEKFEVNQSDLGHMNEVTIYTYHRYRSAASRMQTALATLDALVGQGNPKLLDASVLHGFFRAYRAFVDAAGTLRAAFGHSAEVSSSYSHQCLIRSYKAGKVEVAEAFAHSSKLELAKKALAETKSDAEIVEAAPEQN